MVKSSKVAKKSSRKADGKAKDKARQVKTGKKQIQESSSDEDTQDSGEELEVEEADSDDEADVEENGDGDDDEFEDQGSSSEDEGQSEEEDASDDEKNTRKFIESREKQLQRMRDDGTLKVASHLHIDDLSSDDEETHNTIGNVPLRWYEEYDHIGYNLDGKKIIKQKQTDGIDDAIAAKDDPNYG